MWYFFVTIATFFGSLFIFCNENSNHVSLSLLLFNKVHQIFALFYQITQAFAGFLCKQSNSWASAFLTKSIAEGIVGQEAGQSVIAGLNLAPSQSV